MKFTTEEDNLISVLAVQNKTTKTDVMVRLVKLGIQHLKENVSELQDK